MTSQKVLAYQVADFIDIKALRSAIHGELLYKDSGELFYRNDDGSLLYIFRHGAVSFFNYKMEAVGAAIDFIKPYCRNFFSEPFSDELIVETGGLQNKISHNKIGIENDKPDVLRMIMLNVSQSVTLDYYSDQTEKLLEETNYHTQLLERKGKLAVSGKNLKKFIGKTLGLKNRIAENLYIFDSPPETWEDEQLDKLHNELKRNFDLQDRFRDVSDGLGIVKDNLELFRDLLQYRNSVLLEWVIIILVGVEVLNFFVQKFL